MRSARQPHEARLLSELRSLHHAHSASRRLDGYTSDTTMFADEVRKVAQSGTMRNVVDV